MRRREFMAGLAGAAAWPVAGRGAQTGMPVIGFLSTQSAEDDYKNRTVPFLQGLKETGYVEGQNMAVEYRYAENQVDRLPALVDDLVRRRVAVIFASGTQAALAAKAATTTIPIVFGTGDDPVGLGLVASLNHPGGNLTGATNVNVELEEKRLAMTDEIIPAGKTIAALVDTKNPAADRQANNIQEAARR